ncbi:MAG: TIGR03621 family F420-dependent LLM class oxidoreductase [Acidimicrobiales bacterium]
MMREPRARHEADGTDPARTPVTPSGRRDDNAVRPFRFIAPAPRLDGDARSWLDGIRRIEDLGFDTVAFSDHVSGGWVMEPTVAMTAAASATTQLRVLALVLANDLRHPGLLRKSMATLDVLSAGRVELGLGAGWLPADYEALGMALDPPAVRVSRLEEAVEIVRALDGPDPVTRHGSHYRVDGLEGLPRTGRPLPLLIGGGGPRILALAGRRADIAGIHPTLRSGRIGPGLASEFSVESYQAKIAHVRRAAAAAERTDRGPELQATVYLTMVRDSHGEVRCSRSSFSELITDEPGLLGETPAVLSGTVDDCIEQLVGWRERLGVSYWHLGPDVDAVAPIVAKLAGT